MPDPVTGNRWWGNPWAADPELQAASDAQRLGGAWGGILGLAAQSMETSAAEPDTDSSAPEETADDAYGSLVADWPKVPPLIERHITGSDFIEVRDYWYDHWRNEKRPDDALQCFDWAQFQMLQKKVRGTGDPKDRSTYFQLFEESLEHPPDFPRDDKVLKEDVRNRVDVTDTGRTVEAIEYLKESLVAGIPVMVGIRLLWYLHRPNRDLTTNHFVVVVGMGRREQAAGASPLNGAFLPEYYVSYFDYQYDETRRLYLFNFPNLAIMELDGDCRIAQVRRTARA